MKKTVSFIVKGQRLTAAGPVDIAAGSINFIVLHFDFSSEWTGYSKELLLEHNGTTTRAQIDGEGNVQPDLTDAGSYVLSVVGNHPGRRRATTTRYNLTIEESGPYFDNAPLR